MKYFVTVRIEEQIVVEADNEYDAVKEALLSFDTSAHDPEIVDVWSDEDDY
jgi:hypothetical protein